MHRFTFFAGAGLGFVLGSWVGRGPYEQLESTICQLVRRPEVQEPVAQIRTAARDRVSATVQKVGVKRPDSSGPGGSGQADDTVPSPAPVTTIPSSGVVDPYTDQQEMEFGKAAAQTTIP